MSNIGEIIDRSNVVMNLSLPSMWIETFGLTILEAMFYGKIIFAPKAGAFLDYIVTGENGYLLDDPTDIESLSGYLQMMAQDSKLEDMHKMQLNAQSTAHKFRPVDFERNATDLFSRILG